MYASVYVCVCACVCVCVCVCLSIYILEKSCLVGRLCALTQPYDELLQKGPHFFSLLPSLVACVCMCVCVYVSVYVSMVVWIDDGEMWPCHLCVCVCVCV